MTQSSLVTIAWLVGSSDFKIGDIDGWLALFLLVALVPQLPYVLLGLIGVAPFLAALILRRVDVLPEEHTPVGKQANLLGLVAAVVSLIALGAGYGPLMIPAGLILASGYGICTKMLCRRTPLADQSRTGAVGWGLIGVTVAMACFFRMRMGPGPSAVVDNGSSIGALLLGALAPGLPAVGFVAAGILIKFRDAPPA